MISPWIDNGDIMGFVKRNPESDCLQLLIQVAEGLEYLHTRNPPVIHGDLKAANVLVSELGEACIADFGLAELVIEWNKLSLTASNPATEQVKPSLVSNHESDVSSDWHLAGNPRWQAPELLDPGTDETPRRSKQSDIFAFGRVMFEIFTRKVPFFPIPDNGKVTLTVMEGGLPERPQDSSAVVRGLDDDMWYLMVKCWGMDPAQRPSARDIVLLLRNALNQRGPTPTLGKRGRVSQGDPEVLDAGVEPNSPEAQSRSDASPGRKRVRMLQESSTSMNIESGDTSCSEQNSTSTS